MKKFCGIAIAIAVAFALAPSAKADDFTFTYTGTAYYTNGGADLISNPVLNDVTLTGTIVTNDAPNADGGYVIESFIGGSYSDAADGISGSVSLLYNAAYGASLTYEAAYALNNSLGLWSPSYTFSYDNLFYAGGAGSNVSPSGAGVNFDQYGLLLALGTDYEVNIFQNVPGFAETEESEGVAGTYGTQLDISDGTFTFSEVVTPEPSSLLLLGSGLFALSFLAMRKAKSATRPRSFVSHS